MDEHIFDTVIIGGGQAGLSTGYFLMKAGRDFIILDQFPRIGDSWRNRWDSLHLFTPSQFNGLPGFPFPYQTNYLPSKNEVADYLEDYGNKFDLPVRHAARVNSLSRADSLYRISTKGEVFSARNVIIATGPFQLPKIPSIATILDPKITQIHSSQYANPSSVKGDSVLVVGAGNSGAEIALELNQSGKDVWLSGRDVGRIPANSPAGKVFNGRLIWWVMSRILNINTPIGRKVRKEEYSHGTPLGRATRSELAGAGIHLVPRMIGVEAGQPQIEDGGVIPVDAVVWATGFKPDYSWIDLPIFDQQGFPVHERGVVSQAPGLFFIGLIFQTALVSSLLGGVGMDAEYITKLISNKQPIPNNEVTTRRVFNVR
jgi:putative flavoprotein involved in K+ transport